jgi:hypothetical protein
VGRRVDGGRDVRGLSADGWGGLIALVLAIGVSTALAASLIIISLTPSPVDNALASIITALAGAAVGGLSAYLGISKSAPPPPSGPSEAAPGDDETTTD